MALEPWLDTINQGDVLSRSVLLDEIKGNMTKVLNDYIGRGIEDEVALKQDVATLFTGEIIPSRKDWTTITDVLRVLATVKEQGVMYENFIVDVSDSLGVSDLIKIKDFIDMIQGLDPLSGSFSMALSEPGRYFVVDPKDSTTNKWDTAKITWSINTNDLTKAKAIISVKESLSEDVSHYVLRLAAGTFVKEYTIPASGNTFEVILDWLLWYKPEELVDAYLKGVLTTYDKRGNTSSVSKTVKYSSAVNIPQGVEYYELQYKIDNSGWKTITKTKATEHTWNTPNINGNYRYRVQSLDWNGKKYGGLEGDTYTDWAYSIERYISFTPEKPDKPNPKVSTSYREAIITWDAVPRAEWYEIWMGGEGWAKDNTKNGNNYWQRISSTTKRNIVLKQLNEGKEYTFYVRAGNAGGTNIGSVNGTMKKRVLRKKKLQKY